MTSVISRDSFCSGEVEIFRAVDCWSKANPTVDIKSILAEIRLELLTIPDLVGGRRGRKTVSVGLSESVSM